MTDPDKKKKPKKVILILSIILTVLIFVGYLWILRDAKIIHGKTSFILVIAISFAVFYGIGTWTVNVIG